LTILFGINILLNSILLLFLQLLLRTQQFLAQSAKQLLYLDTTIILFGQDILSIKSCN